MLFPEEEKIIIEETKSNGQTVVEERWGQRAPVFLMHSGHIWRAINNSACGGKWVSVKIKYVWHPHFTLRCWMPPTTIQRHWEQQKGLQRRPECFLLSECELCSVGLACKKKTRIYYPEKYLKSLDGLWTVPQVEVIVWLNAGMHLWRLSEVVLCNCTVKLTVKSLSVAAGVWWTLSTVWKTRCRSSNRLASAIVSTQAFCCGKLKGFQPKCLAQNTWVLLLSCCTCYPPFHSSRTTSAWGGRWKRSSERGKSWSASSGESWRTWTTPAGMRPTSEISIYLRILDKTVSWLLGAKSPMKCCQTAGDQTGPSAKTHCYPLKPN